ncbi:MAG: nucleotide exchange factor GrpE [Bacteroidaceae bacterium]|nr:nucleotide exchange factor GrpE [Bacteroidaceae bacterium]
MEHNENSNEELIEQSTVQESPTEVGENPETDSTEETTDPEKELTPEEIVQQKLEEQTLQLAAMQDKYLRSVADFDNYRKRTIKEKAELIKTAAEKTLTEILPILDDMERALKTMESAEDVNSVREGVDLIYQKFVKILGQQGLKPINTENQDFNVDFHEAIALVPAPSMELKGKVLDCVQTGYTLNEKVIRHAKVAVAQ